MSSIPEPDTSPDVPVEHVLNPPVAVRRRPARLEPCRVEGFQSWSADSQTTSSAATVAIGCCRAARSWSACAANCARRRSASSRSPCTVIDRCTERPLIGLLPR
jgi:hypothetical protein